MEAAKDYPWRVAAIDIGSNALRLVAVEHTAPGSSTVLCTERHSLRLGHDVFVTGQLTPRTMDAALNALDDFVGKIRSLHVAQYKAVATSAVREAHNGEELVRRAQQQLGLPIEIITGSEEARLVHLAVKTRVELSGEPWILVDLGGGSVEVSLADDTGILWTESHTMGSVRLLEELTAAGEEPGRYLRLLTEYTSTIRLPAQWQRRQPQGLIATGGNIESLADLALAAADERGVSRLPVQDLDAVITTLARLSYRDRVSELKLREDRADVILPAAVVYRRLAQMFAVAEIVVPRVGLREGVLAGMLRARLSQNGSQSDQSRESWDAAISLGRRYGFEEPHALQVTRLALSLFDQLAELHGLKPEDRRVLAAAALLHDVGFHISYKGHHKHSLYLIANSELPGLSAHDMLLAAGVARYHRKGLPEERHEHYAALSPADRLRLDKLAGLLRLADALDREHLQNVQSVKAQLESGALLLRISGAGDLLLECWGVQKKADLFRRTFGLEVRPVLERSST